jgi:N-alpha-acetyltransferase 15/16, NatA auxiliary subunit
MIFNWQIFVSVHDNPSLAATAPGKEADAKKAKKKAKKAAQKVQEEAKKGVYRTVSLTSCRR